MDQPKNQKFFAGGFLYNSERQEVLLQKRDGKTPINPYKWGIFGGTSEEGETPQQTFLREVKEELCITLPDDTAHALNDFFKEKEGYHRYGFYAVSNLKKSEMHLTEGEDFDWIPLAKVLDYDLTDSTRKDLEKFLESKV